MYLMKDDIIFYGATWCGDCKRSQAYLDSHHIPYKFINIDEVEGAAEKVKEINHGMTSTPTIVFPNGTVLVEPSDEKLADAIETNKEAAQLSA